MKRRAVFFIGLMAFFVMGCEKSHWYPRNIPETEAERKCVAEIQEKLIKNTLRSIAGHDQDWDDALFAAHEVAKQTCCKARLYEFGINGAMTGRFKER